MRSIGVAFLFGFICLSFFSTGCNELTPDNKQACENAECGENAYCDNETGECICSPGYEFFGKGCVLKEDNSSDGDADNDQDGSDNATDDLCMNVNCPAPGPCEISVECNPGTGKCEAEFASEGTSCTDDLFCNGEEQCDDNGNCLVAQTVECKDNMYCNEIEQACICNAGFEEVDGECVRMNCTKDSDCDDGLACNGDETCDSDNKCIAGNSVSCIENASCTEPDGTCSCNSGFKTEDDKCVKLPICPVPQTVTMSIIHQNAVLEFTALNNLPLKTGLSKNLAAEEPDEWSDKQNITLSDTVKLKVFAKVVSDTCNTENIFKFIYDVREQYPQVAGSEGSTAIAKDDTRFKDWASGYLSPVNYGSNVDEVWKTPDKALGQAVGASTDIVCLGRGGDITLTFDSPIKNGAGYDFAIFENSFANNFIELAYVEVSSDGENFFRFDNAFLHTEPVGAFGYLDTAVIGSLAGKYQAGYGTPFDLDVFKNRNEVYENILDLNNITHIRIIDIIGGTSETDENIYYDSFNNIVYDPYPTVGSAGFDLEAVGVINN